jgi:predicted outer membrane protein
MVAIAIAAITGLSVASAQQSTLGQLNQDQPASTENDRYEARLVTSDAHSEQGPTVKEALVQKLIKANEAEIELAKLAQQKTDNEELKQLAAMIVKDHQQLNQTLNKHAGKQSAGNEGSGKSTADQASQDRKRDQATTTSAKSERASDTPTVPKELCKVSEQACENALKMTKEMLSNYDGQDFNMAFLGQQCVAHTMMLAELKAIESTGPKELRDLASQAAKKVETHLEKAKQLAKKLEDDSKSRG